jgi:hypothetical protein
MNKIFMICNLFIWQLLWIFLYKYKRIALFFLSINAIMILIIMLTGCSTTQYIPSAQIKPVYPQMRECPNLPQATQATYWQIVNVDVPAMYYQCKADHDAVKIWIDKQRRK